MRPCAVVDCFNPQKECYRLVLVNARDGLVLADGTGKTPRLPRLSIPRWSRQAKQVQATIGRRWGLSAFIVDILESSSGDSRIVLAELISEFDDVQTLEKFKWAEPELLFIGALSEEELSLLNSFLHRGNRTSTLSRLGWIHDVLKWVGREASFPPRGQLRKVQQWNASSGALLLRLSLRRRTALWLKAVDQAQSAEYRITLTLASLFPDYLPRIISSHDEWGAWLMADGGTSVAEGGLTEPMAVSNLSRRLAELQVASVPEVERLLDRGCSNMRLEHVRNGVAAALPLLQEAMDAQDIQGLPRLGRRRLEALCEATDEACYRLNAVGIPDTLIHNDLHFDNIIAGKTGCYFIDWDQAGVGNPLLAFEQLRVQLPDSMKPSLLSGYRSSWSKFLRPEAIKAGIALIPPIAIAAQLSSYTASISVGTIPHRLQLRHLRSLTRQLDTALQLISCSKRRSA
jgi:Phosphotransferase enzyme family